MALSKTFIPYGAYWSSPFCRWQGSIGHLHSLELAAQTAGRFLQGAKIAPDRLESLVLGFTVPQNHSFYGAPWVAAMLGAPGITGPVVAQACATSVRVLATAAAEIETGQRGAILGLACDRTSNGPHLLYPNPKAAGGRGDTEEWVWDNFSRDPYAGNAMVVTAENVAKEAGITREEQDEMTLLRHAQYQDGLKDDRAFQKRYMLALEVREGKKTTLVETDEGIYPTTKEGLAKARPAVENGTITFGTQTFPADGNAGVILATKEKAAEMSKDPKIQVQVLGFGSARVKKGFMPMATVPAAEQALQHAGIRLDAVKAFKTHNPFAVNDVYFCKKTGVAPERLNRFGSPLVYGHPQGPTGLRAVVEMIEELVLSGGGYGLFTGCAAGDSSMALVLKVG
jgi:acetyl-CoA acetyltransferase family protein